MFVPPKRLARNAASAAFGAAVCIMEVAGIGGAAAVLTVASAQAAAAQGRLEAEYAVTVSGIPIARGNWVIEISNKQFTAAGSAATIGIWRILGRVHGTSASRGIISGGQPVPTSYSSTIDYGRRIDDVRMVLADGDVKEYVVDPPPKPHPDRVPLTDADRRGVLDPMTSILANVAGDGDPVSPQACKRRVAVFDGRVRFDLRSQFKRIETVKADKGYRGPAVVCAVYFTPISGYEPTRLIKYLVAERNAEVWMVPISGTRVLVPFRFTIPTPLGPGKIEATRFISVPELPRANASAKIQ